MVFRGEGGEDEDGLSLLLSDSVEAFFFFFKPFGSTRKVHRLLLLENTNTIWPGHSRLHPKKIPGPTPSLL